MPKVVIVGAGPAGLTLAMLLAQRGISVTLIEASRNFRRIFRGEGLMPSGLDAIAQMGLNEIVAQIPHRSLDAWEFYIENRLLFRVNEPMEPGGPPCTLISQPAFLEAVLDKANACPTFEMIQGTAVQDLLWQNERVTGVKLSDGRTIAADLVIGTDGRNSIVRQRADLELIQEPKDFDILWFKLPTSPQFISENIFYAMARGHNAFAWFQGSEGNLQLSWTLFKDNSVDWQETDWAEKIASASPEKLATHVRRQKEVIERPILLSIVIGRCPRWYRPGLLLLGDAVHPMSPIRAQGINMAFRDVIVAVNHLLPCLQQPKNWEAIDAVLPLIQAEREPEIIQIQKLQQEESSPVKLLHNNPVLQFGVSRLAPLIRGRIRQSWIDRQLQLRKGFAEVRLKQ
jgi:2-polyprenyl-6-methoxyphenol hydroxylase-like FAD-dependent oxidoreductase